MLESVTDVPELLRPARESSNVVAPADAGIDTKDEGGGIPPSSPHEPAQKKQKKQKKKKKQTKQTYRSSQLGLGGHGPIPQKKIKNDGNNDY